MFFENTQKYVCFQLSQLALSLFPSLQAIFVCYILLQLGQLAIDYPSVFCFKNEGNYIQLRILIVDLFLFSRLLGHYMMAVCGGQLNRFALHRKKMCDVSMSGSFFVSFTGYSRKPLPDILVFVAGERKFRFNRVPKQQTNYIQKSLFCDLLHFSNKQVM